MINNYRLTIVFLVLLFVSLCLVAQDVLSTNLRLIGYIVDRSDRPVAADIEIVVLKNGDEVFRDRATKDPSGMYGLFIPNTFDYPLYLPQTEPVAQWGTAHMGETVALDALPQDSL